MSDAAAVSAVTPSAAAPVPAAAGAGRSAWRNPGGFGFRDILDIVNPLQHLPVITSIYRWVTGDRPGEAAEIAGDALYGGPIGVAFGLVGAITEDSTGHDLGERVLAKVFGSGDHDSKVAAAPAAATSPANSCRRRGGNCRRIAGPGGAAARPCSRGGGGSSAHAALRPHGACGAGVGRGIARGDGQHGGAQRGARSH